MDRLGRRAREWTEAGKNKVQRDDRETDLAIGAWLLSCALTVILIMTFLNGWPFIVRVFMSIIVFAGILSPSVILYVWFMRGWNSVLVKKRE